MTDDLLAALKDIEHVARNRRLLKNGFRYEHPLSLLGFIADKAQAAIQRAEDPFAGREAGMHSQTPKAKEAPSEVRVFYSGHIGDSVSGWVALDGQMDGGWPFLLGPASSPYWEGAPMWRCECGTSHVSGKSLLEVWRGVRRHFWYNHADRTRA